MNKTKTAQPLWLSRFVLNGAEGSRTPVRKTDTPGIYERSLCFDLAYNPPTNRMITNQSGKIPDLLPNTGKSVAR